MSGFILFYNCDMDKLDRIPELKSNPELRSVNSQVVVQSFTFDNKIFFNTKCDAQKYINKQMKILNKLFQVFQAKWIEMIRTYFCLWKECLKNFKEGSR